ncbi:UNVERIFIED_CONTAM: hypothetical protein GTU68_060635 [Idotea baltica]|nr:hypothetical protein [Idotea baltica]
MNTYSLTTREQEILRLVAQEYSSKEIASKLFISNYTVITHRQNLMLKLAVKNTAGLVRRGFEVGVLGLNTL